MQHIYLEGWPVFHNTQWPQHWTNGGTGVSKLTPGEPSCERVILSIEKFNDPSIYIENGEMHTSRHPVNLEDFWKFHRELHGITEP